MRPIVFQFKKQILAALVFVGVSVSFLAFIKNDPNPLGTAPSFRDVQGHLSNGNFEQALQGANHLIRTNPQDLDALLVKGIALAALKPKAEAIAFYEHLSQDHPSRIEPLNNLAVLYAAEGKLDKARITLEKLMQADSVRAVAYQNLNALYAQLANQAYEKALELDLEKGPPSPAMSLFIGQGTQHTSPPPLLALNQVRLPPPKAPAAPANIPIVPPTTLAGLSPASTSQKQTTTEKSTPSDTSAEKAAIATVESWAKAWSDQDVKRYLAHYANNFDTGALSRSAWEADRQARISGKSRISVTVSLVSVTLKTPEHAEIRFRQNYQSDRLDAQTRKVLILNKHGEAWQIVAERTGG